MAGVAPGRLLVFSSSAIGWLALGLSAVGIFGRVSRDAAASARDVAIRRALGATPWQVATPYVQGTALLLGLSSAAGIALAGALTGVVRASLYGVSGFDIITYLGAMMTLAVVAVVATLGPLRRMWSATDSIRLLRE